LNTVNEGAEVTLGGRLFHARDAVTRNERSPVVPSRVGGMITFDQSLTRAGRVVDDVALCYSQPRQPAKLTS